MDRRETGRCDGTLRRGESDSKIETLRAAYQMAKVNNGAPGIDGVTFATIEAGGTEMFLKQLCAGLGKVGDVRAKFPSVFEWHTFHNLVEHLQR